MNKHIYVIIFVLICRISVAQNLIVNGSFENFIPPCQFGSPNGAILRVLSWMPGNYIPTLGYPSVDHYCGGSNYGNCLPGPVPNVGSDGICYLGFHTRIFNPPYNESIYQILSSPLTAGSAYSISFDLMDCQSGLFIQGMSDFCVYTNIDTVVPACPQNNPSVVQIGCIPFDSISNISWKHHSFNFIAPPNSNVMAFSGKGCGNTEIYYYLDNIVLTKEKTNLINEASAKDELIIYPNPTTGEFTIKGNSIRNEKLIEIIDVFGKIIYERKCFVEDDFVIKANLSKGIYFVQISDKDMCIVRKLIVD